MASNAENVSIWWRLMKIVGDSPHSLPKSANMYIILYYFADVEARAMIYLLNVPFEIPHKILYPCIERCVIWARNLRARKRFWNCPQTTKTTSVHIFLGMYQTLVFYSQNIIVVWPLHAIYYMSAPWWRHQMETFSALLALCAGNSPVTGEFPSQRPVMRSFDIFFYLRLNKRLSKQSRRRWFETPSL